MPRHNLSSAGRRPDDAELLTAEVLGRHELSPHVVRVTLGRGDLAELEPRGYDQWLRLFIPVADDSLDHAPRRLTTASYLRMLTVTKSRRPVIRAYTVRAHRVGPASPEIDVDVVVHRGSGTAGPGMTWAQTCEPGDPVGLLDQGVGFVLPDDASDVHLVADESALPGAAGILASLADERADLTGQALIEVPHADDRQDLVSPAGIDITWLVRAPGARPGATALAELQRRAAPRPTAYAWAAGEQALATGARRHWVAGGLPRDRVSFCGYWRAS